MSLSGEQTEFVFDMNSENIWCCWQRVCFISCPDSGSRMNSLSGSQTLKCKQTCCKFGPQSGSAAQMCCSELNTSADVSILFPSIHFKLLWNSQPTLPTWNTASRWKSHFFTSLDFVSAAWKQQRVDRPLCCCSHLKCQRNSTRFTRLLFYSSVSKNNSLAHSAPRCLFVFVWMFVCVCVRPEPAAWNHSRIQHEVCFCSHSVLYSLQDESVSVSLCVCVCVFLFSLFFLCYV